MPPTSNITTLFLPKEKSHTHTYICIINQEEEGEKTPKLATVACLAYQSTGKKKMKHKGYYAAYSSPRDSLRKPLLY